MAGQDLENLLAIMQAASRLYRMAKYHLGPIVVKTGLEPEAPAAARSVDRPSREGTGDLRDVLLRVAAVYAERMQLHQFARVVLVEAIRGALRLRRPLPGARRSHSLSRPFRSPGCPPAPRRVNMRAVRIGAHPVVEVKQHRRALGGRLEQIPETAEHVRAYRFPFVFGQKKSHRPFSRVDIEMIEPEIRQDLFELPLRVDRALQLLLGELDDDEMGFLQARRSVL